MAVPPVYLTPEQQAALSTAISSLAAVTQSLTLQANAPQAVASINAQLGNLMGVQTQLFETGVY